MNLLSRLPKDLLSQIVNDENKYPFTVRKHLDRLEKLEWYLDVPFETVMFLLEYSEGHDVLDFINLFNNNRHEENKH